MVSRYDARYEHLVGRLKKARVEADVSQAQVAKTLGITQPLVSRIESGQRKIDPIEFALLCRLYRKPARYFIPDLPD
jgi:transcriptional regulator with XRE-family HTH domain